MLDDCREMTLQQRRDKSILGFVYMSIYRVRLCDLSAFAAIFKEIETLQLHIFVSALTTE
jgi:hypothetical protein